MGWHLSAVSTFLSETSSCSEVGKLAAKTGVYCFKRLLGHSAGRVRDKLLDGRWWSEEEQCWFQLGEATCQPRLEAGSSAAKHQNQLDIAAGSEAFCFPELLSHRDEMEEKRLYWQLWVHL